MAKGEVGKVGVPVSHIGDMRMLFDGIPLGEMNTSMTINATAAWLLALYVALADEQGVARKTLQGTTQNDIIKEYLSRGTYVFPPAPSMRLTKDVILFTTKEMPKWNPMNVCSYHLQEAGATPVQELAFALATAIGVLDAVKASGQCAPEEFGEVVGRISFFVNAGLRFVTEVCKLRAFTELWDEITRERYGVTDAKQRLFRYGVQVNSLGLTEQQPENNVARILIEMLAVTLSKGARARAVQLPAWNEALGLPRPWDQQWSLRMQQILAYETDLLEYGDVFEGSPAIAAKVAELKQAAKEELAQIEKMGGTVVAVEQGYLKQQLVESNSRRVEAIERGEQIVVGVNRFVETEASPLADAAEAVVTVSPEAESGQIERLAAWRAARDAKAVAAALEGLRKAAKTGGNIMPPSIACAKAGVTTGEWGFALRAAFGEYRAPTGVGTAMRNDAEGLDDIRAEVDRVSKKLGRRLKFLVGKPGLDGHSNGAEQIAARARDSGMEVVYDGIRLTAEAIVAAAAEKRVHVVGLSILSGSHMPLVQDVVARMKEAGLDDVPVVVGGIIPPQDASVLKNAGVAEVYTPKDFELNRIMSDLVRIVEGADGNRLSSRRQHCRDRLTQRARADRLAQIRIHAGCPRGLFVADFRAPGNTDDRRAARCVGQRADAAGCFKAVDARQRHVHEHHVVAALDRFDRFFARADEVGAMAELGEDGVEDDAAVGVVLRAQNRQTARRRLGLLRVRTARWVGGRDRQHDHETERCAAARRAGDGEVAAHQLGERFDDGKPEAGAAIAPRDLRVGLGEWTEQPLDLGGRQPDAAVGDGEEELHAAARGARRARFEPHGAALGEFHRVVDQILDRRAQPRRIADQHFGQIGGDRHFGGETFGLRPRRKRVRQRFDQAPRPERLLLERQRAGIDLGSVDRQGRQRGEMFGAGFDARGPAPLALAEIGARQQFAERQDAGKRGADVVRERGKRRLGGPARRTHVASALQRTFS